MRQVVQSAGGGAVALVTAPVPQLQTVSLLVATEATLISAGTERAATKLAQASLLDKARARPDLVKQVLSKAKVDGLGQTISAVRSRLEDDLALGYSGAGRVLEVGSAVRGFEPGQRVATGGGGFASHADYQVVPWVLAAGLPDAVSGEEAAFCTVASVGLHGLRLADMGVGSKVVVVGLGLIGQLTARIAVASGCDVLGIDLDDHLVEMAAKHGVVGVKESGASTTQQIIDWSRGRGADAVIITAGSRGDSGIIGLVPDRCRDRATVVAIGDIGLDLDRNDFYHKELDLKVARSYGPGRYDRSYEQWGVDYPVGHIRWTEGRNLEAVVDLMASKRLDVQDLISHRFEVADVAEAYQVLDDPAERPIGIVLSYESAPPASRTVDVPTASSGRFRRAEGGGRVGVIGAGMFVRSVVLPSLKKAGFGQVVHVASASGVSAARLAQRASIDRASSDPYAVIGDDEVELLVIATPHSLHCEYVVAGLEAGKDVYCEKPLALSWTELDAVKEAYQGSSGRLYVGFNRRYSPMITRARDVIAGNVGPAHVTYRISAGALAPDHWYSDRREGGRLLGEICHFVDTCNFLLGDQAATHVSAVGPQVDAHDSYHLLIGYEDGSSASVLYCADSNAATPKELIELNGGKHTVVIDNFRSMIIDGQTVKIGQGKGHADGLAAFRKADRDFAPSAFLTTEVVLQAASALAGDGGYGGDGG